ncbi:hypothetical protein Pelo_3182 [Pelomyxa schiedti]|nr:hypothetical protein Pelo_3182 [Pelomyxa schiedti]
MQEPPAESVVAVKPRVRTVPTLIVVYIQFLCGWHSRTGAKSVMCRMSVPEEVGLAIAKIMKVVIPTRCASLYALTRYNLFVNISNKTGRYISTLTCTIGLGNCLLCV